MIRWATPADLSALWRVMRETDQMVPAYTYVGMDGQILVDDANGILRGFLTLDLGRPETHIRAFGVAPLFQGNGRVGLRLLRAATEVARSHGAQGLEGFAYSDKAAAEYYRRGGAVLDPGVRVRVDLTRPSLITEGDGR